MSIDFLIRSFKCLSALMCFIFPFGSLAAVNTWSGSGDEYSGNLPTQWHIDLQTTSASDPFNLTLENSWWIHFVGYDGNGDFQRVDCNFWSIYSSGNTTITFANVTEFQNWVMSTCTVQVSDTGLTDPSSLIQWSFSAGVLTMDAGSSSLQFDNSGHLTRWEHRFTVEPITVPDAPGTLTPTALDSAIRVEFSERPDGGAAITDYEYQLDGGTWQSAGLGQPAYFNTAITIPSLTNGTEYSIRLRAVNTIGPGAATAAVTATPGVTSSEPTGLSATSGDGQILLTFTPPTDNGGTPITDYEYQLNGTWVSAGSTTSPVTINGLTNGTEYTIRLRARTAVGAGTQSAALTAQAGVAPSAPTTMSSTAGDGEVSIAFTPPDAGTNPVTDYEYQLNGGAWTSAGTATSPITITGLTNGTPYTVRIRAISAAGAGTPSSIMSFNTASPLASFDENEEEVREIVTSAAQRRVQSTLQTNRRMVNDARTRFIRRTRSSAGCALGADGGVDCDLAEVSRNNIPFDFTGIAELSQSRFLSSGSFFGQVGNGNVQRLVFGDFDIQHDADTGSTTATINGRVAWERMLSEQTMLGYFLGAELARSEIDGTFAGDQNRLGVSLGGYGVRQLRDNLYLDGFLTFGMGQNTIEVSDSSLDLEADHTTRSMSMGAAVTGMIERGRYEILPEVSFSYGHAAIGDVGFTGRELGLVNNSLVLDAGNVSVAQLVARPEIRFAMDGSDVVDSLSILTFAPRLICQSVRSATNNSDCGAGAEIGFERRLENGNGSFNAGVQIDKVGDSESYSLNIGGEFRF